MPQRQQRAYLLLPLLLQPPWLQLIVAAKDMRPSWMTLLNVGLTLMFLMIRKWVSNASHEIEAMMGLKMRWIETEKRHDGRGKIPDLMEL